MSKLQQAINEAIDAFVADITNLAKQAALETLERGLSGSLARSGELSLGGGAGLRRKSGKRSPDEIQQAAEELLNYVKENPGQRMEAIAKALGSSTKDLTLPTKKLLQSGLIRVEGQKRATSYFPSSGKAAPKSGGKRRGRRKKRA